jgi:hypothetical protein
MKGENMKYRSAANRWGLVTAALVFLFTLTVIGPAEAKQINLKSQLSKSGISMKIVKLDRTDGFVFGLSFTGLQGKSFVLAPGLNGMFLVQAGGIETIMQRDKTGKMQIIQADGDISYILCIIQSVVTFLSDMTLCEGDLGCVISSVIEVVTNVLSCQDAANPV